MINKVVEVTSEGVVCDDGTKVPGNVVIWSTGAEPQPIISNSDLEVSKGYFRVNEFMQSTSHPNIFAGGDCVTMTPYEDREYNFPPKAGVYAVRSGPVIAKNVIKYLEKQELVEYVPQTEFLALLMTGDGKAIGTKFGMAFVGKWVWNLKDYIDVSFMNLFNPYFLFKDYDSRGYEEPIENEEKPEDQTKKDIQEKVSTMTIDEGAALLSSPEDHEGYLEQFIVLERMKKDTEFREGVVKIVKESQMA